MDEKNRKTLSWSASLAVHAVGAILILVSAFHIATPTGAVTDKTDYLAVDVGGGPEAPPPTQEHVVQEPIPPQEVPTQTSADKEAQIPPAESAPEKQEVNEAENSDGGNSPKPFTPTEIENSPSQEEANDAQQESNTTVEQNPPIVSETPAPSPSSGDSTGEGQNTSGVSGQQTAPFIDETKLTELFGNRKPEYPWMARLKRQQGTVVLRAFVNQDGRVSQVTIEKSSGSNLIDQEAQRMYSTWRYQPGLSGQVLKPFKFSLK